MNEKHDGWIIKNASTNRMIFSYLSYSRSACVNKFQAVYGESAWRKYRRARRFKIVKVKLVEVEK